MKNEGNQNAAKSEDEKATSRLNIRVKKQDKAAWVKKAQKSGMRLSTWTTETLNNAPRFSGS